MNLRSAFLASLLASPILGSWSAGAERPPDAGAAGEALVEACLAAWEKAHHAAGGQITLFSHRIEERGSYTLIELTLGTGEGRTIIGTCRIKDGVITHTYD